jgi:hypothetical protein
VDGVAPLDGEQDLRGWIRHKSLPNGGRILKVVLAREGAALACILGNLEIVERAAAGQW